MSALDTVIVVACFAVVFDIGAYFFARAKTSRNYFLADRSVGWVAIGASLFATNISSEHFIGLAGSGASSGIGRCCNPLLGTRSRFAPASVMGYAVAGTRLARHSNRRRSEPRW